MPMSTSDSNASSVLLATDLGALDKLYSGKVRDVYAVDDDHLLIIATDRVSAYDVILPCGIPGKGRLLTRIAQFWFNLMQGMVPNHLTTLSLRDVLTTETDYRQAEGRSMLVKRLEPLPVEAVVRGYLAGSGHRDYVKTGAISGIVLVPELKIGSRLPQTIFTPSTKAAVGDHDENISYADMQALIGAALASDIRDISCQIYAKAARHALQRDIIIADSKFEFGLDRDGTLTLMDEILTPDSSRFWQSDNWQPGHNPASYDKQFIRDYLDTLDWNKTSPGPVLPEAIINGTLARYKEALARLSSTAAETS